MASQKIVKAVVYLRTNKSDVVDQLYDLYTQNEEIVEFVKANTFTITNTYDDFGKGGYQRLYDVFEYCRQNKEVKMVIAKNQTKISRSSTDFEDWSSIFSSIDVELKFVEQSVLRNPNDFLENVLVNMTKLDSDNRSAYIKRGIQYRVQAGYSVGKPPLGYVRTTERGLFAKDTDTANYLRYNIIRFINGALSYEGLRVAVSRLFSSKKLLANSKFRAVVTNPYYIGYVCYRDKRYKGLHKPLLTDVEYKKLTALLHK